MTFGAVISNTSGVTIINNSYKNMRLVKQETHSVSAGSTVAITVSNFSVPIIALSSNASSAVLGRYLSGGVLTFYVKSATAGSFTAYIFDDTPSAVISDTYGMQVFGSGGQLLFNGGDKYLRVLGVLPVPYNTRFPGSYPDATASYPVANAAVVLGFLRNKTRGSYTNPTNLTYDVINTSGGSVRISMTGDMSIAGASFPAPGSDRWLYYYSGTPQGGPNSVAISLVADVSGY